MIPKVLISNLMKRLLGAAAITIAVLIFGAILLIYSQGKRIDGKGKISGSGILQIGTTPNNAKIYINGKFKANSDTNIENLKKGTYTVKIEKDHYTTWEKIIEIKNGLITPLKITLFPSNPSLTAATFDGVFSPKLSNDNKKVVFGIQKADKAGLWILDLSDPQLFFDNRLKKLVADLNTSQFSKSNFFWSSDNKTIFVEVQSSGSTEVKSYLLKTDQENTNPKELNGKAVSEKERLLKDIAKRNEDKLSKLGSAATELAQGYKSLSFSKDTSAVIIVKETETILYDKKPNLLVSPKPSTTTLANTSSYFFLQDSQNHIIVLDNNTLSVMERDGKNKVNLFTGDFDPLSVFSWPDGGKIVITINLNSKQNSLPDLWSIDLR